MKFVIVPLFLVSLVLAGCPTDECTPNETRCYLNRAEICGSDQRWRAFMDCEELGIDWICCWMEEDLDGGIPAGHGCIEGRECPAVDGGTP